MSANRGQRSITGGLDIAAEAVKSVIVAVRVLIEGVRGPIRGFERPWRVQVCCRDQGGVCNVDALI